MLPLLNDDPLLMTIAFGISLLVLIPWREIRAALRARSDRKSGLLS
jgi:hypothetical protein